MIASSQVLPNTALYNGAVIVEQSRFAHPLLFFPIEARHAFSVVHHNTDHEKYVNVNV